MPLLGRHGKGLARQGERIAGTENTHAMLEGEVESSEALSSRHAGSKSVAVE